MDRTAEYMISYWCLMDRTAEYMISYSQVPIGQNCRVHDILLTGA